jgi:hypothetical protein
MRDGIVARLLEAGRKGRVNRFRRWHGREVVVQAIRVELPAEPTFDFGRICDPDAPEFLGESFTGGPTDQCFAQGKALLDERKLRLPYDECYFVHGWSETAARYESYNVIHLVKDGDDIIGQTYFWQPTARTAQRRMWTQEPIQFVLLGGGEVEFNFDPEADLSQAVGIEVIENAKSRYTDTICGIVLLSMPRAVVTADERPDPATDEQNRGRERGKLPPLPAVRIVHIEKPALVRYLDGKGTPRASPRPHPRRGHYRHYKNTGKVIHIAPHPVRGGGDPANYRVR